MTALASRRRAVTLRGAATVVVALVVVVTLSAWGVVTLASSTIGRAVEDASAPVALPMTSTGMIGVLDASGRLASAVVVVLDPSGVGGSLVVVAPEADVASGRADSFITLADGVGTGGEGVFALDAESLTGIGFDAVLLTGAPRLAELLAPIGSVTVDGDVLEVDALAEALVSPTEGVEPAEHLAADGALWGAVAAAVGDGVPALAGAVTAAVDGEAAPVGMESLLRRLFAGRVGHRTMPVTTVDTPAGPVVVHDWSEMLVVMAQIAPARVAAPLAASTVRVVASGVDLAVEAVDRLGLAGLNVVSVDTASAAPPAVTRIVVTSSAAMEDAAEFSLVFGPVDVVVADRPIEGVDVVIELGESFAADLGRAIADDLAGSLFAPGS